MDGPQHIYEPLQDVNNSEETDKAAETRAAQGTTKTKARHSCHVFHSVLLSSSTANARARARARMCVCVCVPVCVYLCACVCMHPRYRASTDKIVLLYKYFNYLIIMSLNTG